VSWMMQTTRLNAIVGISSELLSDQAAIDVDGLTGNVCASSEARKAATVATSRGRRHAPWNLLVKTGQKIWPLHHPSRHAGLDDTG